MIETRLTLCAVRIVIDRHDNKLTAFEVLEDLETQGYPLLIPGLQIVWVLKRSMDEAAQHAGTISIKLDNELLHEIPVEINFFDTPRTRALIRMNAIVIPRPGQLTFSFQRQGQAAPDSVIRVEATTVPVAIQG